MDTLKKLNKIYDNIEKIEEDVNPESDLNSYMLELTEEIINDYKD